MPKHVRRVRADARQGQEGRRGRRSRSATSTSSAASTSSRPSRTSSPTSRRRATSCSPRAARASTRRRTARPRRSSRSGPNKGYFTQGLQRHRLRPGVAAVHQGQGPVHDRRHLDHHDALKALGDKLGFFLMPGREAGSDPVALGGESLPWAITSKSKNADVAAAYIDFLTNAEAADVQVETDNLPAMAASVRAQGAGRARRSSPPGRSSTTATASRRTWTTRRRRSTTTSRAPCRS